MWMSHGTHVDESCCTYEWVMIHIWSSHVTHMNVLCHTCFRRTARAPLVWPNLLCHVPHIDASCHNREYFLEALPPLLSHVADTDKSGPCHMYGCRSREYLLVTLPARGSFAPSIESLGTHGWVISHIYWWVMSQQRMRFRNSARARLVCMIYRITWHTWTKPVIYIDEPCRREYVLETLLAPRVCGFLGWCEWVRSHMSRWIMSHVSDQCMYTN